MNYLSKKGLLLCVLMGLCLVGCRSKEEPDDPNKKTARPERVQGESLDHLIIEEIFYAGNYQIFTPKIGFRYKEDSYIKIHNPTKETLYLDGLALLVTHFSSNHQLELSKSCDFTQTHLATSNMVQFPGTGKDYPIASGKSVLVARVAMDHTKDRPDGQKGCPSSFDLSKADFQWMSREQLENDDLPFNEKVPSCSVIYSQQTLFEQDNLPLSISNGMGVLALVKLGVADKKDLEKEEYLWHCSWNSAGGGHAHGSSGVFLKIPNEWVIDAVNLCPKTSFRWPIVHQSIDAGWTNTTDPVSKERMEGKSLIRKHNGRSYEDTNNSTVDFTEQEASVRTK